MLAVIPTRQFHYRKTICSLFQNTWVLRSLGMDSFIIPLNGTLYFFSALFMNASSTLNHHTNANPRFSFAPRRLDNVNNLRKMHESFSDLILSSFDMDTRIVPFIGCFKETNVVRILVHVKWILHKRERKRDIKCQVKMLNKRTIFVCILMFA